VNAAAVAAAFVRQAELCAQFAAPLYADLCRRAADEANAGGAGSPLSELLRDFTGDPKAMALPLRVLAGVHAQALDGSAPALAAVFAAAGNAAPGNAWRAWHDALAAHVARVREWLDATPQTNEVGRSGALVPGFLVVAAERRAPLRLLELGASAGLNLRWDRFRIETAGWSSGPAGARVVLRPRWRGEPPPPVTVAVASRRGCDRAPLDPRADATRLRLCAYVWPERHDRLRTLQYALDEAQLDDLAVERADAIDWLQARLAEPAPGVATVVYHSSFAGHLPPDARARLDAVLADAGRRATADAPLHRLQYEDEPLPDGGAALRHELRLASWPPGDDRLLAHGQPHGDWIEWHGAPPAQQPRRA
jgi:hypothetical protein